MDEELKCYGMGYYQDGQQMVMWLMGRGIRPQEARRMLEYLISQLDLENRTRGYDYDWVNIYFHISQSNNLYFIIF